MDDHFDQDAQELDRAIDASQQGSSGADASELGQTADLLHSFALSGPQLEEVRVKRSIEGRLDRHTQHQPWYRPGWSQPGSVRTFGRRMATGSAIAVVAVAIGIGSLLSSSGSASAAFLEDVQELSDITEAAIADGVIDDDEAEVIAEAIEELREEADEGSLDDVDVDDLTEAVTLLAAIDETLGEHDGATDDLDELTEAVVAAIDGSGTSDEDGDHDGTHADGDDGDHEDGDSSILTLDADSFTADEMQAAMDALAQLEIDVDGLKADADNALAEVLAGFADWETAIADAETEALALIDDVPDFSVLGAMTEDEIEALEKLLDEFEDDQAGDLLDEIFDDLDGNFDGAIGELDDAFEGLDELAEEAIAPFDDNYRYARDDARTLIDGLHDYFDELKAEAKLAEAELKAMIDEAKAALADESDALKATIEDAKAQLKAIEVIEDEELELEGEELESEEDDDDADHKKDDDHEDDDDEEDDD